MSPRKSSFSRNPPRIVSPEGESPLFSLLEPYNQSTKKTINKLVHSETKIKIFDYFTSMLCQENEKKIICFKHKIICS